MFVPDISLLRFCTLSVMLLAGCGHVVVTPLSNPVKFEFYLAETSPAESLESVTDPETGDDYFLHPTPVLTNADLEYVGVSTDRNGKPAVFLTMNLAGEKRLKTATEAHLDKPVVILLDGKFQMGVIIQESVTGLQITGKFTSSEARSLADGLMK